jgi:hypothetical protein
MATLQSKIRLCKGINVDKDYINVLNYTEEQMLSLCESNAHLVASANDYSFIRNRGTISTNFKYDDAIHANYIAFQNKDYSNKWFFAWIDEVTYIGEENTEIKYTIDVWSTWFDYWNTKPCFVAREHVNNDTIGLNTIPENLDIGDVVQESEIEDTSLSEFYYIAIESSWTPKDGSTGTEILDDDKGKQFSGITVYNKQVFGKKLHLFEVHTLSQFLNIALFILRTNGDGHIADISNIFFVPDAVIDLSKLTTHSASVGGQSFTWQELSMSNEIESFNITIQKQTSFSDYTPKNNKCFTFPYNYLYITNNVGSNNILKYENFNSTDVVLKIILSISIGCSGKIVPLNYKNISENYDESLPLAKYPTCAWSSDAWINWLTQNAVNESVRVATGIFGAGNQYQSSISSIQTNNQKVAETGQGQMKSTVGADINLGVNIAGQIGSIIGNFYAGALLPNIEGGANTGDVIFGAEKNTFTIRKMRVKTEYLKIIDDYFTRFGYKINRVKVPNITGRTYWNYVEIGASEDIGYGDVPSNYMEIINNACRKGVTIWHNHANIGNFALNNTIAQ